MKKRIKIALLTSLVMYLATSFVAFDILWIKVLPSLDNAERAMGLLTFGLIHWLVQPFPR